MAYDGYVYNSWVGGQAVDKKVGPKNSFANSQSLDFRKSPSQITPLPRTRREDGGVVTDLIQNEVMTESGKIYAIGSSGNVYTRTTAGVWSLFGNIGQVGTFGINYRQDQDAIYITGTTSVSSITTVSTSPTLNPGYYGESQSTYDNTSQAGFNVDSDQSGSALTTTILTSYTEDVSTQERFFQTDIQPISKIGVNVVTKGTGNWTLVVHDGLNNQLATATILTANITAGQVNYFTFSTPIQVNVGPNNAQTYHFHLTSTAADGTISSSATNDLSTCDMELWGNRLVATNNGLHPMLTFQQFELIGNGRYLSVWENLGEASPSNTAWLRQGLVFPPGYEVCAIEKFNEYAAVSVERTTTGDNTPQDGIVFYWDGLSTAAGIANGYNYNYFTPIPEGSPEGLTVYNNALHYTASGDDYVITSVAATPEKYRKLPFAEGVYTANNNQTQVYPYSKTVRNGILLSAWPSVTTNTSIPCGVYSWGRVDYTQPNSFGYSYVISTSTQYYTGSNHLTIGMVKNFGSILHISWRDTDTYGIDVVDSNSIPAAYTTWESLITDGGMVTKDKQVSYLEASWLDIQDGVEIVLKYSINRGAWVYSDRYSNANLYAPDGHTNYGRLDVGDGSVEERYNELQIGVDIYCDDTVTTAPPVIGVSAIVDNLGAEVLQ
jgi:hypothetical protein